MAHNIGMTDGRPSMMYAGNIPWHGLGTRLPADVNSTDAIKAAGLDWNVSKRPAFFRDESGAVLPAEGCYLTIRDDTKATLGAVGERYEVLQNRQAFSFFDAVVGLKEAMYHTAGALGRGERIWILAKLPGLVRVVGDDITEKFLLLSNSHDGSSAVEMMFTPIRVVCQNTLNVALADGNKRFRARHTLSLGLRVEEVRETLGIINARFGLFEDLSRKLAAVQMTQDALKGYLGGLGLAPLPGDSDRARTRAQNIMQEVSGLFESGKGADLPGAKGTAWGAFNAVAEYADFKRTTRGADKFELRAKSLLYGSSADLKQRAWDAAVGLAGIKG